MFGRLIIPLVVVFVCKGTGGARDGPMLDVAEFGVPAPRELAEDVVFDVVFELCAVNPRAMSKAVIGVIDGSVREATGAADCSVRGALADAGVREMVTGLTRR